MTRLLFPDSFVPVALAVIVTFICTPSKESPAQSDAGRSSTGMMLRANVPRHDTVPGWLLGSWSGIAYNHMDSSDQCPFQMTVVPGLDDSHIMYFRTEDWYCFPLTLMAANDSSALFREGGSYGYNIGKLRRIGGVLLYVERGADPKGAAGFYYDARFMRTQSRFEMMRIGKEQRVEEPCMK